MKYINTFGAKGFQLLNTIYMKPQDTREGLLFWKSMSDPPMNHMFDHFRVLQYNRKYLHILTILKWATKLQNVVQIYQSL